MDEVARREKCEGGSEAASAWCLSLLLRCCCRCLCCRHLLVPGHEFLPEPYIDALEESDVLPHYTLDALRFTLLQMTSPEAGDTLAEC